MKSLFTNENGLSSLPDSVYEYSEKEDILSAYCCQQVDGSVWEQGAEENIWI
jgi:hypothetical protein